MKLEWDSRKAARNERKHGVSFSEAATVFENPLAVIFDDVWHSQTEQREIIIGYSDEGRLLVISFTEREGAVRIISTRLATRSEREEYDRNAF